MRYECKLCNYLSNNKSNYTKHLKSNKHIKKTRNRTPGEFKCICGKSYRYQSGLSIHQKKKDCLRKLEIDEAIKRTIEQCKQEYKQQLRSEMKHIENKLDRIEKNAKPTTINNTQNNISVYNYALQNLSSAPCLERFTDFPCLSMEYVLFHYEHKNLYEVLGNEIVEKYKKKDPRKQSLWSTDIRRQSYICKKLLADGDESIWQRDPTGIYVRKYIVTPLLKYLYGLVENWIKDIQSEIIDITDWREANRKMKNAETLQNLLYDMEMGDAEQMKNETIQCNKLGYKITAYIAPLFMLEEDEKKYVLKYDSDSNSDYNSDCNSDDLELLEYYNKQN